MKYLDVLVVISPARGGDFEVNVASDAGGKGNSILKLPFAMRDLSGVMFNVQGDARKFHPAEPTAAVPAGTVATFGVKLFEALFQGETRDVLRATEAEAERQPETGVRIRLSMNLAAEGMAEVASLPWELMRRHNQGALVVSVQTPVVRAFDTPKPIYLHPLPDKLRILALVSNPRGTAALNLDDEAAQISKIWATLDNVEFDFVRPVGKEILGKLAEKQYNVIHYMGHGDFDSGAGGLLMMERDDRSADLVSGDTFAAWLGDEPLRLVFLNACNTGTTGQYLGLHPFAGVASALIRTGVSSVVAMQFPISDKAAIIFAQTFYQRIAQGFPVDAAVSEGRKALLNSPGFEWATPVLYMLAPDGNLFDLAKPGTTPRKRVAGKTVDDGTEESGAMQSPEMTGVPEPDSPRAATPPEQRAVKSQAFVDVVDPAPHPRPWFKNPLVLGGIGAMLVLGILVAANQGGNTVGTVITAGPDATLDAAVAAIAAVPARTWIYDADEWGTVTNVLATATIEQLQALADAGHAKAAYLTGGAYWFGLGGVKKSPARAARYYAKAFAANPELVVAQYAMGFTYLEGAAAEPDGAGGTIAGVARDEAKAKALLRQAMELGNASAWAALAENFYEIGIIPDNAVPDPNNPATAAIAAIEARRFNDDQNYYVDPPANVAQSVLAKASLDDVRALAEAGNARANYVMGRVYADGLAGYAVNIPAAVPWMYAAARAGLAEALYFMGNAASRGVPALDAANPEIVADAKLSKAFFSKAGEFGNPTGGSIAAGG